MLKITNIQANSGDSFLIEDTDNSKTLLIDCGFKVTYQNKIKKLISNVDYLILTHSDQDHINGAIPLIEDTPHKFKVGKVYINVPSSYKAGSKNGNISFHQAKTLEELLKEKKISYQGLSAGQTVNISKNINLEVISPIQEDLEYYITKYKEATESSDPDPISNTSKIVSLEKLARIKDSFQSKTSDFTNAVSIALILEYKEKKILFLGDGHPEVIANYLEDNGYSERKKYTFDYIKLSHHGSIKSISERFISMVSCSNFIVSTNGGKGQHPSRETLAKLALNVERNGDKNINFFFNYPFEEITAKNGLLISLEEMSKYNIKLINQSSFNINE
jgi:beta-lactamase superfamily II metal-dependent hydrolase